METPYAAWQALPDTSRKQIQVILQDLAELSDEKGLKVIAEEIARRCSDRAIELVSLEGRLDKAMWFYLNFPNAFDQAALFARADAMATGRYAIRRNDLPARPPDEPFPVTPEVIDALQTALSAYYWPKEMRGRHCMVQPYTRPGHAEYFFAYLDDWPDKQLVFEDDGEMAPRSERFAFSVIFIYCTGDGSLEIIARGGKDVHLALQKAFCRAAFGIEIGPADPVRPAYTLDMLLEPGFVYPTDPADRIKRTRLSRIRLEPISRSRDLEYLELKFPTRITREKWLEIIQRDLASHELTRPQVVIKQASFQVFFLADTRGRERKMTFNVSIPNTCDLKSRPDDVRIAGENCLKLWGISNA